MKLLLREEGECEKNGQDQQGTEKMSKHEAEIKESETLQNEGVIGYFTEDEQQSLKDHKQEGTDLGFIQTKRYMREDWNI